MVSIMKLIKLMGEKEPKGKLTHTDQLAAQRPLERLASTDIKLKTYHLTVVSLIIKKSTWTSSMKMPMSMMIWSLTYSSISYALLPQINVREK